MNARLGYIVSLVVGVAVWGGGCGGLDPSTQLSNDLSGVLPPGWTQADIGTVGAAGSGSYGNGAFTASGSGSDIFGTQDSFHYVYRPLTGDGFMLARVTGPTNTSSWAKAGIMIRETTSAQSSYAFALLSASNGLRLQARTSTGASAGDFGSSSGGSPHWLKLQRQGNQFTATASADGVSWTKLGSVSVTMASSVLIGFAVTAHHAGALSTATFDQVSPSVAGNADAGVPDAGQAPAPDAGILPDAGIAPDAGSPDAGTTGTDAGVGGASDAGSGVPGGFVTRCGLGLCLNGQPFRIHGATAYGTYSSPQSEVSNALDGGVNLLEIVEFETQYHTLSDTMSSATWTRVDNFIATAGKAGLHVVLNLSSYGQSLQAAGILPTTYDNNWQTYLTFIATRVNTVTGVKYANDPTIAMVELWGEIPAPNYSNPVGTTAQLTAFFKGALANWKAVDTNHLINTGGFSYLNDSNSGIDWKTIMADPNDDVCAIEINSSNDRDLTVPMVTQYCHGLGKPWFLSAWSSCYTTTGPQFPSDIDHWTSDSQMATHATDMYGVERDLPQYYASSHPSPTYPAIGSDFWNLGVKGTAPSCDLSEQYFPLTWDVIQQFAN